MENIKKIKREDTTAELKELMDISAPVQISVIKNLMNNLTKIELNAVKKLLNLIKTGWCITVFIQ